MRPPLGIKFIAVFNTVELHACFRFSVTFHKSSRRGINSRQCSSVTRVPSSGTTHKKSATTALGDVSVDVTDLSNRFNLVIVPDTSPSAHPDLSSLRWVNLLGGGVRGSKREEGGGGYDNTRRSGKIFTDEFPG